MAICEVENMDQIQREKIAEKLKKIKALAERGEGGEKETAMRMYEELKAKYELEDEEIMLDAVTLHWFGYATELEEELLTQIFYKVTGSATYHTCKDHMELLQQLADSGATVNFNQGLDIKLINEKELELIKRIKIKSIHFAFDRYEEKEIIVPRLRAFKEATGYDKNKGSVMVYILVNFDTTIEQDIERIQICRELNYSPYPMIYDKKNADQVYKKLQRWCNNFIFWKTPTFEEYVHGKVGGGSS